MTPITTPLKSNIAEIVQSWYAKFVKVDQALLFELVTAANFMDIKALLDLTCLAISVFIKVSYDLWVNLIHIIESRRSPNIRVNRPRKFAGYSASKMTFG